MFFNNSSAIDSGWKLAGATFSQHAILEALTEM
jgi:hypothetical protein